MRARLLMLALAVSALLETSVWALPSFVVSEPLVVPRRPIDVAVGDLNNDGIDDLAIVSRGTNKVSIVLVQPDGTFRQGASVTIGSRMKSVGIGDFNGDGKGDVVVTTGTRNIFVIPGNGDGTFGRSQSIKRCCTGAGVTVADFDGSRPGALLGDDIAIADPANDDVNVLFNQNRQNSATFDLPGARPRAGNKPQFVVSADFTGDGKPDIGAMNTQGTGNDVSSIRNDSSKTFNNIGNFFAGKRARAIGAGDYNKDGTIDVVSCDQRTNSMVLLPNQGGGFFGTGPTIPVSCAVDEAVTPTLCRLRAAQIKDFDGDGNPDIASLLSGINTIRVFVGTASGEAFLDPVPVLNVGNDVRVMKVGRFNNDDKPDMVVASVGDTSIRLILNTSGSGGVPTNTPTIGGGGPSPTRTPTVPAGSTATPTATQCRGQGCPCDIENGDADCNEPFLCAVNGEVCCDTDCAIDNVDCDLPGSAGTCKPIDLPDGDECTTGEQCQSGFCVDGVCCESACNGPTERCNVTPGQCTEEGTVRPTNTPTPTRTGGGGSGTPTPTLKDLGDPCTAGAQCRSTFCPAEDLVCCDAACNGANQACDLPTQAGHCLPINLDDGENCVVDAQCISEVCEGGVCGTGNRPSPTPTPKKTNGSQCTDDNECVSGNCQDQDGVCCNEVCDGENERCDLNPMEGTCLETEVPDGGNCSLDQQCASRTCSGGHCAGDGPTPVFTATRTPNGSRVPTNTRTATPISQPTLILARGSGCNASNDTGSGSLALLLAFPAWWMFTSRSTATVRRKRQQKRR